MTSLYSTDGVIVYNIHKSKLEHAANECTVRKWPKLSHGPCTYAIFFKRDNLKVRVV